MPRRSKGPRLWLEPAERDSNGRVTRLASWVIRDGSRKIRTGCGEDAAGEAEQRLATYIAAKHKPAPDHAKSPERIIVADVISVYLDDVVEGHARPGETKARLARIVDAFGAKRLSAINGESCRRYALRRAEQGAAQAGRREMEDLRAAINHYHREGHLTAPVFVPLPKRGASRERWLTRSEAARLLWAAWRLRQGYGDKNRRRVAQHVARFILVALYTGTRGGAVCAAAIRPTIGRGYVDIDTGLFYRAPPGARQTNKRQPPVPLPPRLLAHLRRWERLRLSKVAVVEWNGKPVARIHKAFRSVRAEAGFAPDVTPHVLRHTAATWLMQNGCDPWQAAGFLGMTIETLVRVYGHHSPDHMSGAVSAIGRRRPLPGQIRDRIA